MKRPDTGDGEAMSEYEAAIAAPNDLSDLFEGPTRSTDGRAVMSNATSELIDHSYDAIELMNLLAQRLSEREIGCREASSMSWLLGRAMQRLEPVINALEIVESRLDVDSGADVDLIDLGSEGLALYEEFRQRRQGGQAIGKP